MKRLGLVALLVLAFNFLAAAGGVGYLVAAGKLDVDRARTIGKILFPDPPPPATQPAATADPATTQPMLRFDELLNKQTGKTAAEQVAFLRDTFDAMSATLERQRREVSDLRRQAELAQQQVARDRAAIGARERDVTDRAARQRALDADAGFQRSLEVYNGMDVKQVKDLFMRLEEETVARYLQAMEPRRVSKLVKEFTSPEELVKAQRLLERMRTNDATNEPTNDASPPEATDASTPRPPATAR